jgi:hypothetical protein
MKPTTNFRRILRNATLGLGFAAVVGGASMARALAADYWHQDRRDVYSHQDRRVVREPVYREHAYREHERFEPRYAYAAPSYGYRYAPAPAYVAPPSLNFVFPIR